MVAQMIKTSLDFPLLLNGNCLELLKQFPDKSIDICITSVPFLHDEVNKSDYWEWMKEFHRQIERVVIDYSFEFQSSNNIVGMCRISEPLRILVWDHGELLSAFRWQPIFVFKMSTARYNIQSHGFMYEDIMKFKKLKRDSKTHINQDPTGPYERCLKYVKPSNLCNLVIDPCMGSGTAGIAAMNYEMNFIGMEIDRDRYEIARKRLADWRPKSSMRDVEW